MVSQLQVFVSESFVVGSEVLGSAQPSSLESLSWDTGEDGSSYVASMAGSLRSGKLNKVLDQSWGVGVVEFEGKSALSLTVSINVEPHSWVGGRAVVIGEHSCLGLN